MWGLTAKKIKHENFKNFYSYFSCCIIFLFR